jgi:hypothetical protein
MLHLNISDKGGIKMAALIHIKFVVFQLYRTFLFFQVWSNLLGTFETSLSGLSTLNDLKIVKSKGSEDSAVMVKSLIENFPNLGIYLITIF